MISNKFFKSTVLFVILMAIGLCSCSSDSYDENSGSNQVAAIFKSMQGNYVGSFVNLQNMSKQVKFQINEQSKVIIPTFPMDNILYKLYPSEANSIRLSGEALSLECPIDSVGLSTGYLYYKTNNDLVNNQVNFSFYTKDQKNHEGFAWVLVKGNFDYIRQMMEVNFCVVDLKVDGHEYKNELCPIDNIFEATKSTE